ncbi:MAG: hypothetical protein Q7R49_01925 [Candidatus Daviesbacteria bacterium]|nr:hypothetical protein [Candidatus Daviesbacteria bacterium]
MLESLNGTNIGNLNLEEPRTESKTFDAEKDVTAKDWMGILEELKSREHMAIIFLMYAKDARILFPERDLELRENKLDWVEDYLKLSGPVIAPDAVVYNTLAPAKIVFNDEDIHKKIKDLTEPLFDDMVLKLQEETPIGGGIIRVGTYLESALNLAILFPEKFVPDAGFLERLKQFKLKDAVSLHSYLDQLATAKLLYPGYQPKLTDSEWVSARRLLDSYRSGDGYLQFAALASNLKILTATEARITEKGVELIMPTPKPDFTKPTPLLPEMRKF